MERILQTQDTSLSAQALTQIPCWREILLLANELEADTITIHQNSTNL